MVLRDKVAKHELIWGLTWRSSGSKCCEGKLRSEMREAEKRGGISSARERLELEVGEWAD